MAGPPVDPTVGSTPVRCLSGWTERLDTAGGGQNPWRRWWTCRSLLGADRVDEMVLKAQQFVNMYYAAQPDIPTVSEDGNTGWATMYALTRCLQYEIGITALSDTFGPATLSALTTRYPTIDRTTTASGPVAVVRIMQAAMYCKGYDGGEWQSNALPSGGFSDRVAAGVRAMKQNAGVAGAWPGDA